MVVLIGFLLWGLTAWACFAAFKTLRSTEAWPGRALVAVWAILILAALAFLMRPEEEITTGEDPAAYFHSAQAFARHGTITFQDPALAELPGEHRSLFRYGHHGFGNTKDACLWIKNTDTAEVGTWFQPAFAWLLAVPIALFTPWTAFLVAPLFALMAGLILARLVRRMVQSETISIMAFVLFLAHPAIAWNARCMRPEMPALFFALSGISYLAVDPEKHTHRFSTGLLAGLALTVAVLFHITAIYILLPAILLAAWRHGQTTRTACSATPEPLPHAPSRFWTGWWIGLTIGLALMVAQTAFVTDPYWLIPNLARPRIRLFATAGLALFAATSLALRFGPTPRLAANFLNTRPRVARVLGAAMALLFCCAMLWIFFFRSELGDVPGLPTWLTPYLSLTDVQGVARLSSRVWSILALIGLFPLCCSTGIRGKTGRRLFLVLAPASLTIGWMFNYMFETRRATTALIPLIILSTAALMKACLAPGRRLYEAVMPKGFQTRLPSSALAAILPCLIAIGLVASAVRGRDLLYRLRNQKGIYAFYENLSGFIREEGDFLFAEYTQTAAPIEHFTGLPLLPVSWGYRNEKEYRKAEQAMTERVRAHPERRHLLVTPFSGTALPELALEHLATHTVNTRALARTRHVVPRATGNRDISLHVLRVATASPLASKTTYTRVMDGSRLGLEGHDGQFRVGTLNLQGSPLKANEENLIELDPLSIPPIGNKLRGTLTLVFAIPSAPESLTVKSESQPLHARHIELCPGWVALEIDIEDMATLPLRWKAFSSEKVYLTDIAFVPETPGPAWPLQILATRKPFKLEQAPTQRLQTKAALALPETNVPRRIWLLASSEHGDDSPRVLSLGKRNDPECRVEHSIAREWRWHVSSWPESKPAHGAAAWHDLHVESAAPPNEEEEYNTAGIRVHAVIVQPIFAD